MWGLVLGRHAFLSLVGGRSTAGAGGTHGFTRRRGQAKGPGADERDLAADYDGSQEIELGFAGAPIARAEAWLASGTREFGEHRDQGEGR